MRRTERRDGEREKECLLSTPLICLSLFPLFIQPATSPSLSLFLSFSLLKCRTISLSCADLPSHCSLFVLLPFPLFLGPPKSDPVSALGLHFLGLKTYHNYTIGVCAGLRHHFPANLFLILSIRYLNLGAFLTYNSLNTLLICRFRSVLNRNRSELQTNLISEQSPFSDIEYGMFTCHQQ